MNKIFDMFQDLVIVIAILSIFTLGLYMNSRPSLQLHKKEKLDEKEIVLVMGNERVAITINDIRDYVDENGIVVLLEEIDYEN